MPAIARVANRITTLDDIFEYLHEEIASLRLSPGDKISEAEIAAQFGVSRQPVRDAFRRLENLDLLLIRPQRATVVKRFSTRAIEKSRFVRRAIEKEVLTLAAINCTEDGAKALNRALEEQDAAVNKRSYEAFGELDYEFHEILCKIAKVEFAFDVILAEKSKVDRLCMLSFSKEEGMPDLVEDHRKIAAAVIAHDASAAVDAGLFHLSRLDETIANIYKQNANFFDD